MRIRRTFPVLQIARLVSVIHKPWRPARSRGRVACRIALSEVGAIPSAAFSIGFTGIHAAGPTSKPASR